MAARDMNQRELAQLCGVKPPSVNGWLSGKSRFLRGENLLAASRALGVRPEWLSTGTGDMASTSSDAMSLRPDQRAILELWEALTPDGRRAVQAVGDALAKSGADGGRKKAG